MSCCNVLLRTADNGFCKKVSDQTERLEEQIPERDTEKLMASLF